MTRIIKNKKFNNKKVLGLASLILVGGLVTSCDNVMLKKEYEYNRIEYSSDGDYKESRQFKPFDQTNSFIYYGKWEQKEDNKYQRIVKEYYVKNRTYEELSSQINKEEDIEKVLGKPEKSYIQISDTLSEEEIQRDTHYEAVVFDKNSDKYVSVKEPGKDTWVLLGCGFGTFVAVGALIAWKKYDDVISERNTNKVVKKKTLKRDK